MAAPIRSRLDEIALEQGYTYDHKAALKVRTFLETYCRQSKHPWTGKPLRLLPWQWDELIAPLYGWRRPDGTRRYSKAIIYCPKKVGKTTLLAGLALYHLFEYPGSEVYCIASDVAQASVLYEQSADFVDLHEELKNRLWVKRHVKTILDPAQPEKQRPQSVFRVLSSTPEGKSGFSANAIFYDELAEWNATHARLIWDRLTNAGMARVNSLQAVISTAQYDRAHIGYEQYRYACDLLDGKTEDLHTLPVVYSLRDNEDWTVEDNWWRVCPSIDHTVQRDYYRQEFQKAKSNPQDEHRFRTFLCCQWVGSPEQWISSTAWARCAEDYTEEDLKGCEVVGCGLDLAYRRDLSAYVLLVRRGELVYLLPRFFSPKQLARAKEKTDRVPYSQWARAGAVTLTEGDTIDPQVIIDSILRDQEQFGAFSVRYDEWGADLFVQQLQQHGIECIPIKSHAGVMAPPTGLFERMVLDQSLRHPDNPCLSWCVNNCKPSVDQHERVTIDKRRSHGRVDGAIASIIACTALLAEQEGGDWSGSWVAAV